MASKKQNRKTLINKIKDVLGKEKEVLFCYLFGSFAYGDSIKESDIDVAVYLSPKLQPDFFDIRLSITEKLTRALGKEVDVVVLNIASPFLRYTIIREGILAFEHQPERRIEFELKTMNDYFDYQPILRLYHNRLRVSV